MQDNKATTKGGYPDMTLPDIKKGDKKFILQYAKAMYADFRKRKYAIFLNNRNRYIRNMMYARGLQNQAQYYNTSNKNIPGYSSSNSKINYNIFSLAPKFFGIILSLLDKPITNLRITAKDSSAKKIRDEIVAKEMTDFYLKPFTDYLNMIIGLQPEKEQKFKSLDEINLWADTDLKLGCEIALETEINAVLTYNKWSEVKKHILRSLVENYTAGTCTYVDVNGNIKVKSVEVQNFLSSYTTNDRFTDCQHFGEVVSMSFSDLVSQTNLTQEEKIKICKNIVGKYDNDNYLNYNYTNWNVEDFNNMTVKVLDFTYRDTRHFKVVREEIAGKIQSRIRSQDYKIKPNKQEVKEREFEVWVKGKQVIGTDILYDYGINEDMLRNPSNMVECRPRYVMYAIDLFEMTNRGLVESCITILDQIQLDWLKIQELKSKMKGVGLAIEVTALQEVLDTGNGTLKPLEILKIYSSEGVLLYTSKDSEGKPLPPPIKEIQDSSIPIIIGLYDGINRNIDLLRQVTGVNEIVDASTPKTNALNGTSVLAKEGTNNALYKLYSAYNYIFTETVTNIGIIIQNRAKSITERAAYQDGVGEITLQMQKLYAEISNFEYEYDIEIIDGTQDRLELKEMVMKAIAMMDAGQAGGITVEQGMRIMRIGNTKKAIQMLEMQRKMNIEEEMARQQKMMEAKSQADIQAAEAASQRQKEIMAIELQAYEQKKLIDHKLELEKMMEEHKFTLERIVAESEGRANVEALKADKSAAIREMEAKLKIIETQIKNKRLM